MEAASAIAFVSVLLLVVVALGGAVGVPAVILFVIGVTDRTIPWVARLILIAAPLNFVLTIALVLRALRQRLGSLGRHPPSDRGQADLSCLPLSWDWPVRRFSHMGRR